MASETTDKVAMAALTIEGIIKNLESEDEAVAVKAATEIRRLTKTSSKNRRRLSATIDPMVELLKCGSTVRQQAALLALLNLAVKDERNKVNIVDAGALSPIIGFLQSTNSDLQDCATAAILTLSASKMNKSTIVDAGAIPLLVKIAKEGNRQARIDAVQALNNLSIFAGYRMAMLSEHPIPALISLINTYNNKFSHEVAKVMALLESLVAFDDGMNALAALENGIATVVEVLEDGTPDGRSHAVAVLLTLCESDRERFRPAILKEGAIPAVLYLTIDGTPKVQATARLLMDLLRNTQPRPELEACTLQDLVKSIVSKMGTKEREEKAKAMLSEMVQVSMEQSMKNLQERAGVVCPASELSASKSPSKVPLK